MNSRIQSHSTSGEGPVSGWSSSGQRAGRFRRSKLVLISIRYRRTARGGLSWSDFPFVIHYADLPSTIWVLAFAHTSRKPELLAAATLNATSPNSREGPRRVGL